MGSLAVSVRSAALFFPRVSSFEIMQFTQCGLWGISVYSNGNSILLRLLFAQRSMSGVEGTTQAEVTKVSINFT
jgi:hypothetical protein